MFLRRRRTTDVAHWNTLIEIHRIFASSFACEIRERLSQFLGMLANFFLLLFLLECGSSLSLRFRSAFGCSADLRPKTLTTLCWRLRRRRAFSLGSDIGTRTTRVQVTVLSTRSKVVNAGIKGGER